ncbi:MAG: DUF2288 family protein [Verrucomicrobiota bacterium]
MILPDDAITPEFRGNPETREKLAADVATVPWSQLRPHHLLGTLYFVDPALDLVTAGAAFSDNHPDQVKAWLKSGDLVKIEAIHAAQWEDGTKEFETLLVTPFVLCRPCA